MRRPKHLEHVYALALKEKEPGHALAKDLFGKIEGEFKGAGTFVANQEFTLAEARAQQDL